MGYVKKYLKFIRDGTIKLVVLYNDPQANVSEFGGKIVHWA